MTGGVPKNIWCIKAVRIRTADETKKKWMQSECCILICSPSAPDARDVLLSGVLIRLSALKDYEDYES